MLGWGWFYVQLLLLRIINQLFSKSQPLAKLRCVCVYVCVCVGIYMNDCAFTSADVTGVFSKIYVI